MKNLQPITMYYDFGLTKIGQYSVSKINPTVHLKWVDFIFL